MPFKPDKKSGFKADVYTEPGFGEKLEAFGYGFAGGMGGQLGEAQEFGQTTLPEWTGYKEPGVPTGLEVGGIGKKTVFPTTKEVERGVTKATGYQPREETSGYQKAGEFLGGFGLMIPSAIRKGGKALLGAPSKTSEKVAREAESMGFKLSPTQVRQDVPLPSTGAAGWAKENQTLANQIATQGTGKVVNEIDDAFLKGRLRDLGQEFDDIYQGKQFNIDNSAIDAIREIASESSQIPTPANVKKVANEIIKNYDQLTASGRAVPGTFAIEGDALQRMRNALTQSARGTTGVNKHEIYELVDAIDDSVARNHPNVAEQLNVLRPKYRNTVVLEDLYNNGGITQGNISVERLGRMLGQRKDVLRRQAPSELDRLGEIGRTLSLRGRFEPTGRVASAKSDIDKLIGGSFDLATILGRTRPARALQRKFGQSFDKPVSLPAKVGAVAAPGVATRPQREDYE